MHFFVTRARILLPLLLALSILAFTALADESADPRTVDVEFDHLFVEFAGDDVIVDYAIADDDWQILQQLDLDPHLELSLRENSDDEAPRFIVHQEIELTHQTFRHRSSADPELLEMGEAQLRLSGSGEDVELGAIRFDDGSTFDELLFYSQPEILRLDPPQRPPQVAVTPQPRSQAQQPPPEQPPRFQTHLGTRHSREYYFLGHFPFEPDVEAEPSPDAEEQRRPASRFDSAVETRQRRHDHIRNRLER